MYFDNAATTSVDSKAIQIITDSLYNDYHNPSALYLEGQNNYTTIQNAKQTIGQCINAENPTNQIYFTSGGTEGNNWILKSCISKSQSKKPHIITSSFEHHSILNTCKYLEEKQLAAITYIQPNQDGYISIEDIKKNISSNTILVSIMFVNNVLGTIQNIKNIGKLCKENNILFATDAVQAISNVYIDVQDLNIDFLTCSGHKLHAPKGVGFAYIKKPNLIEPLLHGGGQENHLRAGTENIPYIKALQYCIKKYANPQRIAQKAVKSFTIKEYLKNQLFNNFTDKYIMLGSNQIGTINLAFKNISSDILVWELGQKNVQVSVGSACDNGSFEDNYVLKEINYPSEYIKGNIRITFNEENTIEECDEFIIILKNIIKKLRGYV